eukprot:jgi/Chrzof1/2501/Cz11g17260.t1
MVAAFRGFQWQRAAHAAAKAGHCANSVALQGYRIHGCGSLLRIQVGALEEAADRFTPTVSSSFHPMLPPIHAEQRTSVDCSSILSNKHGKLSNVVSHPRTGYNTSPASAVGDPAIQTATKQLHKFMYQETNNQPRGQPSHRLQVSNH